MEIRHRLDGFGNGATYTSLLPDSSETYTTHLPSGENCADVSLKLVARYGAGLPSPVIGRIMRSPLPPSLDVLNNSNRPSGDQSSRCLSLLSSTTTSASPTPPADLT